MSAFKFSSELWVIAITRLQLLGKMGTAASNPVKVSDSITRVVLRHDNVLNASDIFE